jgi:hypothetical protein
MAHLGEEAEDGDGEEARVERGDGGGPGEVPELLGHVPGEAGRVQRCHARAWVQFSYKTCQRTSTRNSCSLVLLVLCRAPVMAAG